MVTIKKNYPVRNITVKVWTSVWCVFFDVDMTFFVFVACFHLPPLNLSPNGYIYMIYSYILFSSFCLMPPSPPILTLSANGYIYLIYSYLFFPFLFSLMPLCFYSCFVVLSACLALLNIYRLQIFKRTSKGNESQKK